MGYYVTTGMKKLGEVIVTGICAGFVLWSMQNFRVDMNDKFKMQEERSDRMEKKLGQYITRDEFNQILEAKLKQFKVNKEGRLIVAP